MFSLRSAGSLGQGKGCRWRGEERGSGKWRGRNGMSKKPGIHDELTSIVSLPQTKGLFLMNSTPQPHQTMITMTYTQVQRKK